MIQNKPYEFKEIDGGDYTMALSYLLSGRGPVGESGEEFTGRLREVHFYKQDDIDDICVCTIKRASDASYSRVLSGREVYENREAFGFEVRL